MPYMDFSKLKGTHAAFSPSQPSWLNYDDDKVVSYFINKKAAEKGTRLHAWAEETINLGIRQPKSKNAIYLYVNDAIGYRMDTEVVLYYSDNFYGTADSLCFRDGFLRIHDLKTGVTKPHMEQLMIYNALFCLQNNIKPSDIKSELRIYQNELPDIYVPEPKEIKDIADKIIHFDQVLKKLETEGA